MAGLDQLMHPPPPLPGVDLTGKTEGISNNEWFLNRYDRTHVINMAVTRELN